MTNFYFGGSSSDDDISDIDSLPYPAPLSRPSFLTPSFDPTTYLSSLRNRHQTLEDLRSDLRTRSQELSKELLDLVNRNYQDFLNLGGSLRGGEEKVEEVRVGLLGFRREIEGINSNVKRRRREVDGLVGERKGLRNQIEVARSLLRVESRLEELEQRLMVSNHEKRTGESNNSDVDFSDSEESSSNEDDYLESAVGGATWISIRRTRRLVQLYMSLKQLTRRIGMDHPYIIAQQPRMFQIESTLLLDLSTSLRQALSAKTMGQASLIRVLSVYRDMDESKEALKVLREVKL